MTNSSADWWEQQRSLGNIPLGAAAKKANELPNAAIQDGCSDDADADYLKSREPIIHLALKSSIAAALALHEIHSYKDGMLWKADYPSFESYCRSRWNYRKSHAYRLRECGEFIQQLEQNCPGLLPASEGQIRPVLQLPAETGKHAGEKS